MGTDPTVEPRFVQVVLDVKDEDFDSFFLGRLNASLQRQQGEDFTLTPQLEDQRARMLLVARGEYERVSQAPPPLAVPKDYSKLPEDTQDLIKKKSRILGRLLTDSDYFPLMEGESLASYEVTILKAPWERFDAGLVAYLQETNLGKVAFFLPYLRLDIRDASLNTLRGTYVLTTKINPQAALTYMQGQRALAVGARPAMAATAVDPGKALLTFATVAAFALPEPFGVLTSGALSVVQMFFGGSSQQADAFKDAMQALLDSIQAYIQYEEVKVAANKIQSALHWLNTESTTIQDLGTTKAAHDHIAGDPNTGVKGALANISTEYGPNSPLSDELENLYNVQLKGSTQDWDLRMRAFDVLAMGVATYVTFLRVRTQMQAALETQKGYTGATLLYGFYDNFRIETTYWATRLAQRINDLSSERIGLVGPLQRGKDTYYCIGRQTCDYDAAVAGFWTFTDNEPGRGGQGKWQDTAKEKYSCGQLYYDSIQHKDQAETARNAYIQKLNDGMDQQFSDAKGMIQGLQDAIAAWNESMTPRAPQSAPSVDQDVSKWQGDVPQGANWVNGAKVRYAVTFANGAGASPQGPWGTWINITNKAWPLVVNIPTDPLALTTARHLHRQFAAPDGTVGSDEIVTIIPDNEDTTYQDMDN